MNQKELNALIYLLEDPDEEVFHSVSKKLIDFGEDIIPQLESTWENDFDELQQSRIEQIIQSIHYKKVKEKLKEWRENNGSLKEAVYILTAFQYQNIDLEKLNYKVKAIVKKVWLELNYDLTPLEQINVINHIFFIENNFKTVNFDQTKNFHFFINDVIQNKKGANVALGLLYLIVAQELKIPLYGIVLPDQVIIARIESVSDEQDKEIDISFYVNPNNGGIVSKSDITKYLNKIGVKRNPKYYLPFAKNQIIQYYIKELIFQFESENDLDKVDFLWQLSKLLD